MDFERRFEESDFVVTVLHLLKINKGDSSQEMVMVLGTSFSKGCIFWIMEGIILTI